jgi:hypothetical protein
MQHQNTAIAYDGSQPGGLLALGTDHADLARKGKPPQRLELGADAVAPDRRSAAAFRLMDDQQGLIEVPVDRVLANRKTVCPVFQTAGSEVRILEAQAGVGHPLAVPPQPGVGGKPVAGQQLGTVLRDQQHGVHDEPKHRLGYEVVEVHSNPAGFDALAPPFDGLPETARSN